ncbi:HAD family hydrolase [Aliamphritea spongicola]|uniref:HAD family hydrolase n=1 Tax=Aliamphritea spongicola TaxID=707589 RepID=UPI00196A4FD8|nr:HAD-IA family hydrolase [Aliamphritea spongicola]MBN3564543.1 HAD-IA family hydrolase [Aliamphritea spongicola]
MTLHSKQLEAVLFDLDGTLIDTAADFHRIINILREEQNLPPISYEALLPSVSDGARAMVETAFSAHLSTISASLEDLQARMLALYLEQTCVDSHPFNGITDLLHWLGEQSIPWGVVTNKPWLYTEPLMKQLNLQPSAGSLICPEHIQYKKPDPEGLLLACQQLNCEPQHCVYVGDHIRDIEAGNRAGMLTIAAAYGYINDDEDISDWNSNYCITQATELQPLLARHYNIH